MLMMNLPLAQWIKRPELLNADTLLLLKLLVEEYPYFQTARLLYLKNLFQINAPTFKAELKKSVVYISDLSILFYYIEKEQFQVQIHEKSAPVLESTGDRTLDLIEQFLQGNSEEELSMMPIERECIPDYFNVIEEVPEVTENTPLPLTGQTLIDKFIAQTENQPLLAMETASAVEESTSVIDTENAVVEEGEEEYLTETLAKIYIKQHRYEKALEIIEKLALNYPKKNPYFADQIRFLKKVIINAKTK